MSIIEDIMTNMSKYEGFKLDLNQLLIILIAVCAILAVSYIIYSNSELSGKEPKYTLASPRRSKYVHLFMKSFICCQAKY